MVKMFEPLTTTMVEGGCVERRDCGARQSADEEDDVEDDFDNYATLQPMGVRKTNSEEDYEAADMASLQRLSVCRLSNSGSNTSRLSSPRMRVIGGVGGGVSDGGNGVVVGEKRLRREIANSNERRRMQSINTGFQSLRSLLPRRADGEKISKASILQQTADFIFALQADKEELSEQLDQLKRRATVRSELVSHATATAREPPPPQAYDVAMQTSPLRPAAAPFRHEEAVPVESGAVCGASARSSADSSPRPPREILAPPKKRKRFIPEETSPAESSDEGVSMLMCDEREKVAPPTGYYCGGGEQVALTNNTTTSGAAFNTASGGSQPPLSSTPAVDVNQQWAATTPVTSVPTPVSSSSAWELEMVHRQLVQLRLALDRERRVRLLLEDEMRRRQASGVGVPPPPPAASGTFLPMPAHHLAMTSASLLSDYPSSSPPSQQQQQQTSSTTPLIARLGVSPLLSSSGGVGGLALPAAGSLPGTPLPCGLLPPPPQMSQPPPQMSASSTTKQSLDAIVEAIKHLEGDQLFVDVDYAASRTTPAAAAAALYRQHYYYPSAAVASSTIQPPHQESSTTGVVSKAPMMTNTTSSPPNGVTAAALMLNYDSGINSPVDSGGGCPQSSLFINPAH